MFTQRFAFWCLNCVAIGGKMWLEWVIYQLAHVQFCSSHDNCAMFSWFFTQTCSSVVKEGNKSKRSERERKEELNILHKNFISTDSNVILFLWIHIELSLSFFGGYSTSFSNNHNLLSGVWAFRVWHIGELDDDTQKDGKELKHIC